MEITLNLTRFAEINEEVEETTDHTYYLELDEFTLLAIAYYAKPEDDINRILHNFTLSVDYEKLETLGYIKIVEEEPFNFILRDKATIIFATSSDEILELAREYRRMFPQGIRSGGYLVRSDEPTIANKLRKFMKNFKQYSKDQILEATQRYIDRKRAEGWKYMKTASYFIYKDGESTLATECEMLNTDIEPSTSINEML